MRTLPARSKAVESLKGLFKRSGAVINVRVEKIDRLDSHAPQALFALCLDDG